MLTQMLVAERFRFPFTCFCSFADLSWVQLQRTVALVLAHLLVRTLHFLARIREASPQERPPMLWKRMG